MFLWVLKNSQISCFDYIITQIKQSIETVAMSLSFKGECLLTLLPTF